MRFWVLPVGCVILLMSWVPLVEASARSAICDGPCRIPILMYHHIRDPAQVRDRMGKNLSVSPSVFSAQLDALRDDGFNTITFQELASGSSLPKKPIILTFDDGCDDAFLHALPILKAHHMVGTFFIITGDIGKPSFLTADQLRTISDSGMEIGAHTVSHRDLSAMGTVSAYHEIADSAMHLRITYHVPVVSLAYPSGHYRSTTPSIARLARMRFAVTTHHGIANEKSSPLLLPRIRMSGRQSGPVLVKWLNRFLIHRTS